MTTVSSLLLVGVLALAAVIALASPTPGGLLAARLTAPSPRSVSTFGFSGPGSEELTDTPSDGLRDTAMMLELAASMLDAGSGLGRALELIAQSATPPIKLSLRPVVAALAIGADWETAWRTPTRHEPEVARLKDALSFAALTGAPSASILYAQAARERREQFRAAEKRAAALGVKLVVPLGLCSLPAFICLGIVPVLIGMIPAG
ncbi:type II secretion system F family protein [Paenarthrobacter sp. NPDC089322]|uniref:type II secretion system F family protein n=1 Tax=Paenarthrobacter sp. NPDC089322 TaxID=3155065 RepID=UPI00341AA3FD